MIDPDDPWKGLFDARHWTIVRFPTERCRPPRWRPLSDELAADRKTIIDRLQSTPAANANGPRLVVDNDAGDRPHG